MTLLENLIKIHNVQGGTIHQYCDILADNFDSFERNYDEFVAFGLEFNNVKAFKKLAERVNYKGLKF